MKKQASLYDNSEWNDESDLEGDEEEFANTTELRKRFLIFKVKFAD